MRGRERRSQRRWTATQGAGKIEVYQSLPVIFREPLPGKAACRFIRGFSQAGHDRIALTIGNFDGVHRGHQAMLSRLSEAADDLALASAVLTFEPHPREFFAPNPPRRDCPRCATSSSVLRLMALHAFMLSGSTPASPGSRPRNSSTRC